MTHTPGPWFVNGPWHIQAEGQQGDARPRIIAQMVHKHNPDAHLIAAAPSLLAALEYVVQWHRDHDSGEGELFGLDYVTTCIGAIREAKGAS